MKTSFFFAATLTLVATNVYAEECKPPVKTHSAEFEKLKTLEGKWEGETKHDDKQENVTVTYHVTSGGSAVVETLFPGTPQEMVSVYTESDHKLSMTHYCMLGNQPRLDLVNSSPTEIALSFSKQNAINPNKEDHMHALRLVFIDNDNIVQNWSGIKGGKAGDPVLFKLHRVSENR